MAADFYSAFAVCVLFLHALFIVWVVFGAVLTRSRPMPSVASCHFPDLGNPNGANAVALPFNAPRELAGTKGGRRAVPGRLPAPLYGQAGLSRYFRNGVDSGGRVRLRLQPSALWQASVESSPSQPTADLNLVA
jgi:hypothetical protein